MKDLAEISIDDEVAVSFSYCSGNYIHVTFDGYFDIESSSRVKRLCTLVVKQWSSASVKEYSKEENKWQSLDTKLGIISMVFSMKLTDTLLEVVVLTLDNKYLIMKFEGPIIGYILPDNI